MPKGHPISVPRVPWHERNLSAILATTGRPDMAERCVQQLIDTTAPHKVQIVVAIDAGEETVERLAALEYDKDRVDLWLDYEQELRGAANAWNDALRHTKGDPIIFAADDLTWEPGWLDAALAKMDEFEDGWGMVGYNDGHWHGDHDFVTHYLLSRRFIIEVLGGVVAWPCYQHSFHDVEISHRAKAAGRYAWAEDAHVHHSHWLFGDRPQDETDRQNLGGHAESQQRFNERAAAGFPNDYEPAITA